MNLKNDGYSLLVIPTDYTLVDLETTGLNSKYDKIIEVGCIKYHNGSEVARYQTLVKPPIKIPYGVELKTGITNEMVADAPKFEEIAKDVWEFLKGEIIVGHNVDNFDMKFLYENFKIHLGLDFDNDSVDTLKIARKALPNIKRHNLDSMIDYFKISPDFSRHRAIGDCQFENLLLGCLKNFIEKNNINLTATKKKYNGHFQNYHELMINLKPETFSPEYNHIFFEKCCVFTGKLEEMSRMKAAQIVVNIGGRCEDNVTQRTNFLIVGDTDYKEGLEGYETNKMKKAKKLIEQGQDLQIIPESTFYELIAEYLEEDQ